MPAGVRGEESMPRWRTTVKIAVPIEPPTRCSTVSCGEACATWSRRRTLNAAVIDGIIDMPMPKPRKIMAVPMSQ